MNRSELRLWLSGVLDGLDAKPELIDRVMRRIDQAYGSAPTTATERDTVPSSPQYGEPVAAPPPVKDVETKYPPRRKGSVAAAVVATRTGDPLKAKYKPEDPEVLLME